LVPRVGTKVFVFSRKFSRKLTFRFCEIFVTKIRNFHENSEMKSPLQHLWTKILFLIIPKQKICTLYVLLCQNNFKKYSILKGLSTLGFFHQTIPPGPVIYRLKPFRVLLRIRRDTIDFRMQKSCMRCPWHRMHDVKEQQ
jgi:hypothetical protein